MEAVLSRRILIKKIVEGSLKGVVMEGNFEEVKIKEHLKLLNFGHLKGDSLKCMQISSNSKHLKIIITIQKSDHQLKFSVEKSLHVGPD